jgi:glycine oxidase
METTTDVVIVGGGVIGCAIAYFLRGRDVAVTVLERGEIGGQASSAAAGLLAPLGPLSGPGPFADLLLSGFAALLRLIPELEEESGLRLGYEQSGALRTVSSPKRVAHLQQRFSRWQPLGLQLHWLSRDEVRQREPLLAAEICGAVYAPQESQIAAPRVVQAFAGAAQRRGARIYSHQEISRLLTHRTKVTGVATAQGETIFCDRLIIASGAWAAQCGEWLNVSLPISPLHGQLLALSQPAHPLHYIVFGEAIYLAPRGDVILVGATREERGFDTTVAQEGTTWLLDRATRLVPVLHESEIEARWAGLRPRTPDSQPILGAVPPWENVLVATGHNSVGIILSAITGQCIAEMAITGRAPAIIQPFSIERFSMSS